MQRRVQPGGVRPRGDEDGARHPLGPVGEADADDARPVVQHGRHRGVDEHRTGPLGRDLQGGEQDPVVDGQVVGHRQPAADLRAEPGLQPAQLAAGQPVHGAAQPGQVRGEGVELGAVAGARGGDDRAVRAQPGGASGGVRELGGEGGPAADRRDAERRAAPPRPATPR